MKLFCKQNECTETARQLRRTIYVCLNAGCDKLLVVNSEVHNSKSHWQSTKTIYRNED